MTDRPRFGNNRNPLLVIVTCAVLFAGCEDDPVQPEPDPDAERAALVALYEATDGPGWGFRQNWLSDEPLGSWYGVEVDASQHVVELRLPDNGLTGSIPAELGNLTGLEVLVARDNRLSGTIPAQLGNLASLVHLDVAQNRLTGPIPESLGRLTALQILNLFQNELSGPIPPELGTHLPV